MRRNLAVATICVTLVLGSACSSASSRKASVASPARPDAVSSGQAGGASAQSGKPRIDLTQVKRPATEIIHTAEVSVQAKDVNAALRKAIDVVRDAGGDLFTADAALADPKNRHVHAVFKVPPERFDAVMEAFSAVGKVTSSRTSTEDVTGQVVDLDARLAAARTGAQRLRELLARSGNVTDLLQVEQALAQREGEVESLDAQLTALRAQVIRATITLDLSPAPMAAAARPSHDIPGFAAGLRTGVAAFVNATLVGATAFGFALPFLLVVALVGVPTLRFVRRRRRAAPVAG